VSVDPSAGWLLGEIIGWWVIKKIWSGLDEWQMADTVHIADSITISSPGRA
jgi:hypothetical protein